ncbi:BT_3928 family protein [Parabacteroides sp. PF5-6]|uniref:BT_3928 family protein n=1 Tax=Parabacteroides sp. PF5-6 TaxID=1742403 RepID=UPI002404FF45|nr:BT_3928 family protein [Parabacteroides sp. PF5-6]MDF9831137.1 putative membrane protein YphA (DoxX/SURF4 family) [Parabacteroides sp. PF5-6]
MKYRETIIKGLAECCRVLIGAVFVFSGFVKAVDPVGFALKIGDYLIAFGLDRFQSLSQVFGFNLIAIEFMLGVCVLLGVYRRYASFLALAMMAFMTPLTLYLALFDPVSDCGCFGDAVILSNWETFGKNVVLLAAAIFLFIHNQRIYQFFTYKVYWFVALFAFFFCSFFTLQNYRHLPVMDFRPYKVGTNIPEAMAIPEGAPEDEYLYSFIYEKDGAQQTFGLDNLPAEGSGWTFVESQTTLIKQGYVPLIAAFNLYNPDDQDVTQEILQADKDVFLLVSPNLGAANDEYIDQINGVFDYAQEHALAFYGVTGSPEEEINRWIDYTGAEYPFLQADDVLLKTMIRANPGLILLRGGTVWAKWHFRDIPEMEEVKAVMDDYRGRDQAVKKEDTWMITNLLTFAVPLLFVWGYDYLRNRRRKAVDN